MTALDLGDVEEAGGAADDRAAGKIELRDRLQAALVEGARAIGDAPAALEERADRRMRLEALKFLERVEERVAIIEPDDEADGDLIVLEMIDERATIGRAVHRPADGMRDEAGPMLRRLDLPQLLDADAEGLGIAPLAQLEALEEGLGQRAATAFGEQRLLADQLDAGREMIGRLAVLADPHAAGGDAAHPPRLVVEHLGGGEAGVDLDAERLGLAGEPATDIAEADDIVAVIVHLRRRRQADRPRRREEDEAVLGRRRVERRAARLPVGNELVEGARLDHRPREDMGADLRTLLDDADGDLARGFLRQLLQPDRGGEARGAGPDDHDIVFHRLALHASHPALGARRGALASPSRRLL